MSCISFWLVLDRWLRQTRNSDIRQGRINIYRMGNNKEYAGGSAVFKERTKGSLIVKIYVDGRKLFKKRTRDNDPTVQWKLNPPMWASSWIPRDALTSYSNLNLEASSKMDLVWRSNWLNVNHTTWRGNFVRRPQRHSMIVSGWFHLVLGSLKVSRPYEQLCLCRAYMLLSRAQAKRRSNGHHQCPCPSAC